MKAGNGNGEDFDAKWDLHPTLFPKMYVDMGTKVNKWNP